MPPGAPLLRLLLSLLLALACGLATAVEPLRIGIFAYRPKPIMEQRFQPLADYLGKVLGGRPVELLALEQAEMEAALAENRLDFLMTNPSHYLVVRSRSQLASIVATVISRDDGLEVSSLGGVIVTAAQRDDINTLKDLQGKRIGVPGTRYLGGYQTQILEMLEAGIPLPASENLQVLEKHDKVIEAVLAGQVDAGFVRTGIIESLQGEGRLNPAQLKVINPQNLAGFPYRVSTRLYPEWPFIALPTVDRSTLRRVSAALLSLDAERHIGVQPGFELEKIKVSPRAAKAVMDALRRGVAVRATEQLGVAAHLKVDAPLGCVQIHLGHLPRRNQTQRAGKQRFNSNAHETASSSCTTRPHGHVDKPLCDLPTCPHGATTTTDCRRWFPHETTRGPNTAEKPNDRACAGTTANPSTA